MNFVNFYELGNIIAKDNDYKSTTLVYIITEESGPAELGELYGMVIKVNQTIIHNQDSKIDLVILGQTCFAQ